MSKRKKARITGRTPADAKNQVVTCVGGDYSYRRTPCAECPWRLDSPVGAFPASAYVISAPTSYDMSQCNFACHMKGATRPAICAGFLLRAHHNLDVRMAAATGKLDYSQLSDGGVKLYDNYRAMAVANGVDEDDPALKDCR